MKKIGFILLFLVMFSGLAWGLSNFEIFPYDTLDDSFINNTLWRNVTSGAATTSEGGNSLSAASAGGGTSSGSAQIWTNNFLSIEDIETYINNITFKFSISGNAPCSSCNANVFVDLFGDQIYQMNVNFASFSDTSTWDAVWNSSLQKLQLYDDGVFKETIEMTDSNLTFQAAFSVTSGSSTSSSAVLTNFNYTLRKIVDVNLISPVDTVSMVDSLVNFTSISNTSTIHDQTFSLTNATLFVWRSNMTLFNETFVTISGTSNITLIQDIPFTETDTYTWNVLTCESGDCNFGDVNNTFVWGFVEDSQEFNNVTTEGQTESFALNVTVGTNAVLTNAKLIYNNTDYIATVDQLTTTTYRITRSLRVPDVTTQVNQTFFWTLTIDSLELNTTQNNQTVNAITLDNCGSNTLVLYNLTLKDEGDQTVLNGDAENTTIEVDLDIYTVGDRTTPIVEFSQNFSETNPVAVCLNSEALDSGNYEVDAVFKYGSSNRVTEFYNIRNFTIQTSSLPQEIDLFDLKSVDSQEFLITFKDSSFTPLEGVIISITRKYINEGVFKTVEQPITDIEGNTIAHLVLTDAIYTLIVTKDGQILATFDNIIAFCDDLSIGDCKINLNAFSTGTQPTDFITVNDVSFSMEFDQDTRTITVVFNIPSGSVSTMVLDSTLFDNRGNTTVCSDSLISSSGTLTCVIPISFGNATVLTTFSKDSVVLRSAIYSINEDLSEIFGGTGVIFLILLYMTLPLMMVTSGVGIVIMAIVGIVIGALLNIFVTSNIIGFGSTILWFMIAGGIIIWKVSKRE